MGRLRATVKQLRAGAWEHIKISEMKGHSPAEFVADAFNPTVGSIYSGDIEKPFALMASSEKLCLQLEEKYEEKIKEQKLFVFLAHEAQILFAEDPIPDYVAEVFPDGTMFSVDTREVCG